MTEVAFHSGVDDPLDYACRLLRKASRQRVRVAVCGPSQTMASLDVMLWTFDPASFIAHRRVGPGWPGAADARTGVWLMDEAQGVPATSARPDTLLNLTEHAVADPGAWRRIIEIVPVDEIDRQRARQRWRDYVAAGLKPSFANADPETR